MFSNLVSSSAYAVCAPILPLELERKGISGSYIGLVFALYSVGSIVWSPIVGKYFIDRVGASNLLALGLGIMGITFVCFGFIHVLEGKLHVLTLTFTLRLMQGMACATHQVACLSLEISLMSD